MDGGVCADGVWMVECVWMVCVDGVCGWCM